MEAGVEHSLTFMSWIRGLAGILQMLVAVFKVWGPVSAGCYHPTDVAKCCTSVEYIWRRL